MTMSSAYLFSFRRNRFDGARFQSNREEVVSRDKCKSASEFSSGFDSPNNTRYFSAYQT